ncbi:MAG: extracellular solute-binding protein [Alphaproteobacteria bacterium]|nr:extracellular solute-binding protein [Alphaproteobacteria bacterium]
MKPTILSQTVCMTLAVAILAFTFVTSGKVHASEASHGLAAFDELKYPADFPHFDYVNPDAPKGGRLSMIGSAGKITFDSFNDFILTGDTAQGLSYIYDSLMVRAYDEPDAVYGLIAKSAVLADDKMSVTFKLRDEARFADGSPVTAADVVFSFQSLKEKGHPNYRFQLRDVTKAEALDPLTVRYQFTGKLVRDLPLIVATLPVLPKAFYDKQPFEETWLVPPLGSGPYEIASFNPGTYVTYRRREDYWAKDLPVNRGHYNFDELRYEYYRDRTAELQNLLNGTFDLREEFTSVNWATGYNVPAVNDGRILRSTLPDATPSGAQGFLLNTRREKFKDPRVRKALDYAFNFEWTNKNLFYGLYKRTASFFENSDMKANGKPGPEELALLEPFRDKLPPEVFGEPYTPPVSSDRGQDRKSLREADRLFNEAGWTVKNGKRVNAKGEQLTIEFLTFLKSFIRIINPYISTLKRLGVEATVRLVDAPQYERRVKSFDFDITTRRYVLRLTPGVEMKNYWSSSSANVDGSLNLAGISDPVIDALIDKALAAKSRAELVTATRAIDRVLRAGHYWVPHWYKSAHNMAFWNKFSWPQTKPKYDRGIIATWWYDADKAAKLNR